MSPSSQRKPMRVAEFFAGIGMIRKGLVGTGFEIVWANDVSKSKAAIYGANFGLDHYEVRDVRLVKGKDLPDIELATASFPCTDISLAGDRAGLEGEESSAVWEFTRVMEEMGRRKPNAVLLENVTGLVTSNGGDDLSSILAELNRLGYWCDIFQVNASWFVPQSRPRLFILGAAERFQGTGNQLESSEYRPTSICRFIREHPNLNIQIARLPSLPSKNVTLGDVVERFPENDAAWWDSDRVRRFEESLAPVQAQRLGNLVENAKRSWRTAYRRTRGSRAIWEIREDDIAGCLRTARGGSSKQALLEVGCGKVKIRWMTPREYARLQGAPETYTFDHVKNSEAYFGFGDAVCVPVIEWIGMNYLSPLLRGKMEGWVIDGSLVQAEWFQETREE